ncbi:hypothetical protein [Apilactobacillus micheneri]|uniref:hypothetical protein n=1 Tax=Apilactobacillus micheneri TaxID=1899430 RepID=UPI000D523040|nr:hypothetical protein [Apilactobacillus micheneri]GAY80208.1 hypothetical protein NBRC113063_01077 [Apilactobacillus micheneri]
MSKINRNLFGLFIIIVMIIIAVILNNKEIIVPEMAALTVGTLVYQNSNWIYDPVRVCIAPSLSAIAGFIVNQFHIIYVEKILLVLVLVLLLLKFIKSVLAPSFATGLLPIIIDSHELDFIWIVFILAFILAIFVWLQKKYKDSNVPLIMNFSGIGAFLLISIIWIILVIIFNKPHMAAIPPVLVVFYEVIQKDKYEFNTLWRHILALWLSASLGMIIHTFIYSWIVVILISLPMVFAILKILHIKLPASYAFPLLALVLPKDMFVILPISSLLASTYFLGSVWLYKNIFIK